MITKKLLLSLFCKYVPKSTEKKTKHIWLIIFYIHGEAKNILVIQCCYYVYAIWF